ncbi:MAG: type II secretion system minor pseudopilin GspK [Parahaliea sp.]
MHYRPCNYCLVSPRRQSGAALVIALLVFAVCAALMVAMRGEYELFYQRAANSFVAWQGRAYLRGAEALAIQVLVLDYEMGANSEQQRDDLKELWAAPPRAYPLEDGSFMEGSLEDLQGRFNLNNLALTDSSEGGSEGVNQAISPRFTPAQQQFIRLLQSLETLTLSEYEAIAIVEAIADWLDTDSIARLQGAEDDYYLGRRPAHRAANRRFSAVSELRSVAHVTAELYQALAPLVTVWPAQGGKLNIHTASSAVLRSLNADDELQPLTVDQASALFSLRDDTAFTSVDNLLAQPLFSGRQTSGLKTLLGETSEWFLLTAKAEVAGRNLHLYSVLHRNQRQVEAFVRSTGEL